MTIPGTSPSIPDNTEYIASVPPVDAPIAITFVAYCSLQALALPTSLSYLILLKFPILTVEAIFILVINSLLMNSPSSSLDVLVGFATKSTAPAFNASKTLSVNELTITTGIGCCGISFLKNSIPFILGISISRVITSGLCFIIISLASNGFSATATTSIDGSALSPFTSTLRNI